MTDGWRLFAACRGADTELFFPKPSTPREKITEALDYCRACPVAKKCRDVALADDRCVGIWGGTTLRERNRIRTAGRLRRPA